MNRFLIEGGCKIDGSINIHGAKNSVLPVLAGALICSNGVVTLKNCPRLSDVQAAVDILRGLGCEVENHADLLVIDVRNVSYCDLPEGLVRKMRSSIDRKSTRLNSSHT